MAIGAQIVLIICATLLGFAGILAYLITHMPPKE